MSIELHPSFLHFKWQQTRFCFYFLLLAHFIFSMTYSGYVVLLYNTICDPLEWRDREPSLYYVCKRLCMFRSSFNWLWDISAIQGCVKGAMYVCMF